VQSSSEKWTGSGGAAAGGTVGVDGGPTAGANGASTGTYQKDESTTQYAGGHTVTKTVGAPGTVKKLSIAVVVPFDDTGNGPAVDEAAISRVIGAAAGIDTTRGDTIEVATVPATITPTTVAATPTPVVPGGLPVPVVGGAGGGLFVLFVIFKLRGRKKKKKATVAAREALNQLQQQSNDLSAGVPANWASNAPAGMAAARQETDSIRADLDRMANETPESLAALLSTWLSKS
jgi:flagellar M-ring protein FliF